MEYTEEQLNRFRANAHGLVEAIARNIETNDIQSQLLYVKLWVEPYTMSVSADVEWLNPTDDDTVGIILPGTDITYHMGKMIEERTDG